MERLKNMKETLMTAVQAQLGNLATADTQELGAAVDMVKDLSEAIYYCTITKAMEEEEKNGEEKRYYREPYPVVYYTEGGRGGGSSSGGNSRNYDGGSRNYDDGRDMDRRNYGRMYYDANNSGMTRSYNPIQGYSEREMPIEMRDMREGRSPISRKTYMETKEKYHDKNMQMKELEKYMQELSSDIVEMIEGATPEEKQYLSSRVAALATKING